MVTDVLATAANGMGPASSAVVMETKTDIKKIQCVKFEEENADPTEYIKINRFSIPRLCVLDAIAQLPPEEEDDGPRRRTDCVPTIVRLMKTYYQQHCFVFKDCKSSL